MIRAKDSDRYRFANFTKAQPLFRCLARLGRGKVIPVSVLRLAHLALGGVDLDLAVDDDVLPLDRADMTKQVGVEREVRRGGNP